MTIGTAIVVSIGIIAVAWLATIGIGALIANKRANAGQALVNDISAKIIANREKMK